MSTEDVRVIFRGPCQCGAGQFVVIESAPDHPFVRDSQRSWSTEITCAQCKKNFVLVHQRPQFLVVHREEIEKKKTAAKERANRAQVFMTSPRVLEIKNELIARLASILSVAQVFGDVRAAGFSVLSPDIFVATYPGAEAWATENLKVPSDVIAALRLVGRRNDPLELQAAEFSQQEQPDSYEFVVRALDVERG